MMTFHVGQKVVCVDASTNPVHGPNPLVKGATYVIRDISHGYAERPHYGVHLLGLEHVHHRPDGSEIGYHPARFRPLIERKTDISIFTKILTDARVNERV